MEDPESAEYREKNQISDFSDFYFSSYAEKKNSETGHSLNAVEREPVLTRVINPNASEASYKPIQHSYRKMKLNIFHFNFFRGDFGRGILSWNRICV